MEIRRDVMRTGSVKILRYVRRTNVGGAVEYVAQFLGGLIHPELLRSGATCEEERRPLPGDDLVPRPLWEATRAVTIDATPLEVWPWVAQMGYGRGGWYGWNPLEREDTGVSRLLEKLPSPRVGDVWLDGPGCDETKGAFTVKAVEPPRFSSSIRCATPSPGGNWTLRRSGACSSTWHGRFTRIRSLPEGVGCWPGSESARLVGPSFPSSGWGPATWSCSGGSSTGSRLGPRRLRVLAAQGRAGRDRSERRNEQPRERGGR